LADRDQLLSEESDSESSATGTASITSTSKAGPTVLRLLLGTHLRRLREAAGITADTAGYYIRGSRSKIGKLETGQVRFKERDLMELLDLYGVVDEEGRQPLRELARLANTSGSWHDYSDILPIWFEAYIGLEMSADEMWVCGVQFVPELLQTEGYLRAVTQLDHGDIPTREIDHRVALRMQRQARFLDQSDPPRLRVMLDEAVLRRQVGSPVVMSDQLKHIAEIAERPNVTVQVVPLETNSGPAPGSFSILRFAGHDLADIVYVEQLTSALYLDKPADVDVYMSVMERLSAHALSPHQTTLLLRELL
jgi:hypothetical protein